MVVKKSTPSHGTAQQRNDPKLPQHSAHTVAQRAAVGSIGSSFLTNALSHGPLAQPQGTGALTTTVQCQDAEKAEASYGPSPPVASVSSAGLNSGLVQRQQASDEASSQGASQSDSDTAAGRDLEMARQSWGEPPELIPLSTVHVADPTINEALTQSGIAGLLASRLTIVMATGSTVPGIGRSDIWDVKDEMGAVLGQVFGLTYDDLAAKLGYVAQDNEICVNEGTPEEEWVRLDPDSVVDTNRGMRIDALAIEVAALWDPQAREDGLSPAILFIADILADGESMGLPEQWLQDSDLPNTTTRAQLVAIFSLDYRRGELRRMSAASAALVVEGPARNLHLTGGSVADVGSGLEQ